MDSLVSGDLRIDMVAQAGGTVQLEWRGKSNDRSPGKILAPYFASVLARAAEQKLTVEQHFENIDHFNSSTIAAVIQLIQDARTLNVPLVLVYDQTLKWQRLSFDALRVFAHDSLLTLRSV